MISKDVAGKTKTMPRKFLSSKNAQISKKFVKYAEPLIGKNIPKIYDFSKSYILALSTYCKGKIDEWDVINEAIVNNGFREDTWYKIVNIQANSNGEIGYHNYFAYFYVGNYENYDNWKNIFF